MTHILKRERAGLTVLIFKVILLFTTACGSEKFNDPVSYNDSIVHVTEQIAEASYNVTNAINAGSLEEAEGARKKFIEVVNNSKAALEEYGGYKGNNMLKTAAIESCMFYGKTGKEDFSELIRLYEEYQKNPGSDEIIDQFNALNMKIAEESEKNDRKLRQTQQEFAEKFDFKIL